MVDLPEHRPFPAPRFITQAVAVAVTKEPQLLVTRSTDLAVAAFLPFRRGAAVEMAGAANSPSQKDTPSQETTILVAAAEEALIAIMLPADRAS